MIEIAGVNAHRIEILDRANNDAVVGLVADDLHLEFLPAEHALLDQHLVGRRSVDAALDDVDELALGIGEATAGATHGEARADDRRQANVIERLQRLRQRLDLMRTRRSETDLGHRLAEELAVFGLVDRLRSGADHLDLVAVEDAHFLQAEGAVERRLSAHCRQQREAARRGVALLGDDLGDDLGGDRLYIGPVRHLGIGHDRGRVRVDEDDAVPFRPQSLAGLRSRIVEFARLADDDWPSADDEDGRDVGPFRHSVLFRSRPPRHNFCGGRTKKGRRARGRYASFLAAPDRRPASR